MKFEILGRKIGALDKVRQKSLKSHSHNLTFSHFHMFGTKWRMIFWTLSSRREIWDTGKQNWSIRQGKTKITLKSQSHNLTFSHSFMFGTKLCMIFWTLSLRQEIWDTGKQNWSIRQNLTKITLKSQSHNLTFSHSHMFGTKWHMIFWMLSSRREIWDTGKQNRSVKRS